MKYTVCYEVYHSIEVEAEDADEAYEIACEHIDLPETFDDYQITLAQDEEGNTVYY